MNSLIGLGLLFVASLGGFAIANGYKRRLRFLNDMDSFLGYMQSNCAFLQDSIKRVLVMQKEAYGDDFNKFLGEMLDNLDKRDAFLDKWRSAQNLISIDEAKFVVEFFSNLGKLDSLTQVGAIKSAKDSFQEMLQKAKQLVNTKGTMSVKLGIIIGIGLFIVCV